MSKNEPKTLREKRFAAWRRKVRKAEKEVASVVKPIVDKYDPESLLKMDCSRDEYDSECEIIAKAIVREGLNRMSVEELGNLIAFAWHSQFGSWGTQILYYPKFKHMAAEIHPNLPDYAKFHGLPNLRVEESNPQQG